MKLYYTGEVNSSPIFPFPYDGRQIEQTISDIETVIEKIKIKSLMLESVQLSSVRVVI